MVAQDGEFNVPKGFFGAAGSPLVEGGRVIANIGGAKAGIIAFDARKGNVVWTYGRCGKLFVTRRCNDRGPAARAVPHTRRTRRAGSCERRCPVSAPVACAGERLGQRRPARCRQHDLHFRRVGPGAAVLRLDGSTVTPLWSSDDVLSNTYATSVYLAGVLYGYHGRQNTDRACARSISRAAR